MQDSRNRPFANGEGVTKRDAGRPGIGQAPAMLAALLTTWLFSMSAVCATRTSRWLGAGRANFWRLLLATVVLAVYAHGWGAGWSGGAAGYFLVSGLIGFGLGDIALFHSLKRVGSRLGILLVQCLAAPFAVVMEWWWLGVVLDPWQLVAGAVLLAGVAVALLPGSSAPATGTGSWGWGVVFGVLGALGQAGGAVLSRKAYAVLEAGGTMIDGGTAAYQRIVGGVLVAAVFWWWSRRMGPVVKPPVPWPVAGGWVVANSLAGPVLGVSCYQWALSVAPSGLVLPVVATTPLVILPFSWKMEGDRPGWRALAGSVLAVAGTVALVAGFGK